ncbi:hypothetical protein NPIL_340671 [Nephila pilipes]|uniref:Uncharacterized protein n=1 Tax=Nephila pilipes TaxID=299642 RepID=A0A8X6MT81_NEPPI|nr:hypothetical protein NPIL_340671 [Nephila pilipes]
MFTASGNEPVGYLPFVGASARGAPSGLLTNGIWFRTYDSANNAYHGQTTQLPWPQRYAQIRSEKRKS